ncbi:hypothetical protein T4B_14973 [Trichinella pseudospiralis]|uniref:Uncharacterized protein n=1 Tax=Trichinella pseudospiralis TaxID=6337 RepID=A0A0V1HXN5_TRIPS|nr:hypothetical protein T4B_14973 [Trichinella pseudospiralis]
MQIYYQVLFLKEAFLELQCPCKQKRNYFIFNKSNDSQCKNCRPINMADKKKKAPSAAALFKNAQRTLCSAASFNAAQLRRE